MSRVFQIFPFSHQGMLVFDDVSCCLDKEPFVQNTDLILLDLCSLNGIEQPEKGFSLKFSESSFEGFQIEAKHVREENGGNWYLVNGHEGWLCPALFKYFPEAPDHLYIAVAPLP